MASLKFLATENMPRLLDARLSGLGGQSE